MANKTNSQRLIESRRKREEEKNSSSSSNTSYKNSDKLRKRKLEREIGFDTFEADLQRMGSTIGNVYNGWQTQETMANTKTSVENMQKRINAYQDYQKKYGGTDISEVANGYQSVLDDWDNLTTAYGYYKDADSYSKAVQKSQFDKQFKGLTYDDVQAKLKEYDKGSAEHEYLSNYTNYTSTEDFEKALANIVEEDVKKKEDVSLKDQLQDLYLKTGGAQTGNYDPSVLSTKDKDNTYADKLTAEMNKFKLDNAGDKYLSMTKDVDFAEKSKYVPTEAKKDIFGKSYYEDEIYEYINNPDRRAGIDLFYTSNMAMSGNASVALTPYQSANYDQMTDTERGIFNALWKEDKTSAYKYLEEIQMMLDKRATDKLATDVTTAMDDEKYGKIVSPLLSVATPVMGLAGGVSDAGDVIASTFFGADYNPYDSDHATTNLKNVIREKRSEQWGENGAELPVVGNVNSFLYNTGMSIADTALGAFALGTAYTPIMGMSAYQQTAKDLTEAGATQDEIKTISLVSGIAEAGFEYAGIDNLFKTTGSDSVKSILKNTLKQMGAEATEESLTEITNVIADTWVRGGNSEYKQMYEDLLARGFSEKEAQVEIAKDIGSRVAQAGIGGALSGGVMGGVYSTNQYSELSKTGKGLRENERVQDVMDLFTPEEAETYKVYSEYANKGVTADNIKDAQLGNLYATKESGAVDTLRSKKTTADQKESAYHTLSALNTYRSTPNTKVKATGENVDIEGVKKVEGETVLATSKGDMPLNDVQLSTNHAEILSYAEGMSEEKANVFVAQYDGTSDVEAYKNSFEMAYAYGETGFGADSVLKNKGILTEAQASEIYKSAITNKVATQQKAIDEINAKYGKTVTVAGKFDDSIIDYNSTTTDGSKVNWNSLTTKQRDAITLVKGFSEATGVNITFIKSDVVNGKRVGKNGSYNPETNTIEIDVYAGVIDANVLNDSIIPTLSHEMTHWMKAKSPAMYSKMREHIMETLVMDGKLTSEERVAREMVRIQKNHPDIKVTEEMAIDEIMARACEDMLSNSDTARKMLNRMTKKEQSSFIAKVKETFENLMQWVNDLLSQYKSNSEEAKLLRQYKDRLKQLSKMWDKALEEAVQTNSAMQMEGKATNEEATQMSDRDSEGDMLTDAQVDFFKNSKARDEDGNLAVVYHGTVREFYAFDREYGNAEGDMGKGFYFTNSIEDVERNYANFHGADFENKLMREAEMLEWPNSKDYVNEDGSYMEASEIVEVLREKYATAEEPITLDCYLNIENPCYVGSRNTYLFDDISDNYDIDDYEDEDDYYADVDQMAVDYVEDAISAIYREGYDAEGVADILYEAISEGGIKLEDLKSRLGELYLEDDNGNLISHELARIIVESLGYDGIIDDSVSSKFKNMGMRADTVHYIVFNSNQAKLTTNENPTDNEDIRYSDRDSEGTQLTAEQVEYFKKSKVRDDNGNLLVVYHGTRKADFTKFNRTLNYFTDSEEMADSYSPNGDKYVGYLNITKPFVVDAQGEKWSRVPIDKELKALLETYGGSSFKEDGKWRSTPADIASTIQDAVDEGELDYDGVIVKNVDDTGSYWTDNSKVIANDYIAFSSNQFKNIDNTNPTNDPDIRYSDRINSDEQLATYNLEGKWNDYIGVQKEVVRVLKDEGFFDDATVSNNESGMSIRITTKGIRETLGSGNRFQTLPKKLKINKVATIRSLPKLIETGVVIEDNVENSHDENGYQYAYIGNEIVIDGEKYGVRISIKKKVGSNHFWIHNIDENKNSSELLSPSRKTVLKETQSFSDSVTQQADGVNIQFSDRDNVSIYDLIGEYETLQKQNAKLAEDVARLKERLKLEKQVTNGNTFNENQLNAVAGHLRKVTNSTYDKKALVEELKDVYTYIVTSPQLDWTDLMAKCYEVAKNVLDESKGYKVTNDYYKSVLEDIRRARITLNDEQIQEAKSAFGTNYRDAFMGRVMLVKNGTSLDQKWSEWSAMYPEIFDADISPADQIVELSSIYDALREGAETYEQYNDAESIRAFAVEIYNQYWNVSTIRTTADRHDREIKRLNFEHRKAMNELRADYKKRVEDQKVADAIHYGKKVADIRKRRDAEVKKAKELGKQRLDAYKERVERNAKIDSITNKALTLNKWLTKNSKEEHIPEVMKVPVAYLLDAIDFSSKQLLGMRGGIYAGTPTKKDVSLSKALEQVHDMVLKINSAQIGEDEITEIYGTFADFPVGFAEDIKSLSGTVNDIMRTVGDNAYVLNQMSMDQLEELDAIVSIMKSTVTKMNKFLAIRHAEGVANLSQQSMLYMDSLGKAKERGELGKKVEKLLDWNNALPYHTFKRFGEGGHMVYEALQNGWDTFAFNVKDIIDYAENTYTSKEVETWSEEVKEFSILEPATDAEKSDPNYKPTYQKVKMTVPQIMSLYCLQKREQAKGHLFGGGMRVADFDVKGKTVSQTEGVILSASELEEIINSLTDRQRAVADELQKFMNTTCADWGNEVSMLRFGYKAFGEENYFPIQSDKNNLAVNDETEQNNSLFRLLNMSFTKATIKQANNRIVVSDIFDVFAQHSSDMAKYNALALPVLDAFKWYNYKEKTKKGDTQFTTRSLKQSLEKAFGKGAQNYIVTFLRDINGEQSGGRDTVGSKFFSNAKLASVGFNIRVIALQPTSYLRASAVIDPKYLSQAFAHKLKYDVEVVDGKKKKVLVAEKYCGIALWKSLGFYDTNINKGVAELIKHEQTTRDKIADVSLKGAEIADKVTWGYLWNACELEVRDKQKNLKVGSEEYYTAVADRLREVIYSTQVVDSTMTRSQMMRGTGMYDKILTSFASEPTVAYNMLQDAYMEWKFTERQTGSKQKAFKKHGKKLARVLTAYTVTNLLSSLVEAGFDIFRDDEDEMTAEELIALYLKNFASNMSILNKIPYAREAVSMLQGYSSSRTDTQWLQYATYAVTGLAKNLQGEGNPYTTFKNLLRAVSYGSGVPLYNVWRDSTALLDKVDALTVEDIEEMFNETIGEIYPSLKSK